MPKFSELRVIAGVMLRVVNCVLWVLQFVGVDLQGFIIVLQEVRGCCGLDCGVCELGGSDTTDFSLWFWTF